MQGYNLNFMCNIIDKNKYKTQRQNDSKRFLYLIKSNSGDQNPLQKRGEPEKPYE